MPKLMRTVLCLFLLSGTLSGTTVLMAPSASAAECNWGIMEPWRFQNAAGNWIVKGGGFLACAHSHDTNYMRVSLEKRLPGDSRWYLATDVSNTNHNDTYIQKYTSIATFPAPYYVDWRVKIIRSYACNGSCTTKYGDYGNKVSGLYLHTNLV